MPVWEQSSPSPRFQGLDGQKKEEDRAADEEEDRLGIQDALREILEVIEDVDVTQDASPRPAFPTGEGINQQSENAQEAHAEQSGEELMARQAAGENTD